MVSADRHGWAVAITRADGSRFLAVSGHGLMPAVWTLSQRKYAAAHKCELKAEGFNAAVVRVLFNDVRIDTPPLKGGASE